MNEYFEPFKPVIDVRAYMATQILAGMWSQPGLAESFLAIARQTHPEAITEFAHGAMAQSAINQAETLIKRLADTRSHESHCRPVR
jgi:hypothetical protein